MSEKRATDEEIEAWGLRHAVRISSVSDMRTAFDDAATLHMVTTPTQAAQIEALHNALNWARARLSPRDAAEFVAQFGPISLDAAIALSNTGKK